MNKKELPRTAFKERSGGNDLFLPRGPTSFEFLSFWNDDPQWVNKKVMDMAISGTGKRTV